jgi:hypothetical protein
MAVLSACHKFYSWDEIWIPPKKDVIPICTSNTHTHTHRLALRPNMWKECKTLQTLD